jgi:hypothetical protein
VQLKTGLSALLIVIGCVQGPIDPSHQQQLEHKIIHLARVGHAAQVRLKPQREPKTCGKGSALIKREFTLVWYSGSRQFTAVYRIKNNKFVSMEIQEPHRKE